MDSPARVQNSYRVEVSGWDASENFFVEKSLLEWQGKEQKENLLQSAVREGCVLFVRLLQPTTFVTNIPIAYQAAKVIENDAKGRTRVCLTQIRSPASRETGEA